MIDFKNLKIAFADKTNTDLNRAYFLFKGMSNPLFSKLLTALSQFALKLHLPIKPIIKATVYKQFCGGETIKESQSTIEKLWKSKIGTILDFSAEGKESTKDFNRALKQTLSSIKKAAISESVPFSVFKLTGICKFSLLEKINNKIPLSANDQKEKREYELRVNSICQLAHDKNVAIFIDAEESWIQDAIDSIAEEMMVKYNTKKALIFNTIQLYRNDRLTYLNSLLERSENNFFIGIKLVRGAYHEQEIERAKTKNYPCPVHTLKKWTDTDYDTALETCIKNISRISVCAGTHNENSTQFLANLMKENGLNKNDNRIYFSQLLGMSDHISYNLSAANYNVSKYVPYGPVKDVMPYLVRRAEENTSIAGQMGRELINIIEEKKRRKNA
ncbi:MAG: Bifunctional protein PutA [Cryomorphaceae bacterium]|nr:MAG: Bifunctional protein PutA [Cryomorphaceae bacterium]